MSASFASFEKYHEVTDYKKKRYKKCPAKDHRQFYEKICFSGISPILDIARKLKSNTVCICRHEFWSDFLAHLSRRLIGELIVYQWSGVRRPSVRRPSASSTMLKDLLLRNRWSDRSQILCGASLGRGNDILFAASGSHDQDGRHAHIW